MTRRSVELLLHRNARGLVALGRVEALRHMIEAEHRETDRASAVCAHEFLNAMHGLASEPLALVLGVDLDVVDEPFGGALG